MYILFPVGSLNVSAGTCIVPWRLHRWRWGNGWVISSHTLPGMWLLSLPDVGPSLQDGQAQTRTRNIWCLYKSTSLTIGARYALNDIQGAVQCQANDSHYCFGIHSRATHTFVIVDTAGNIEGLVSKTTPLLWVMDQLLTKYLHK